MPTNLDEMYFQEKTFALDIKNSWPVLGSIVNVIVNSTLKLDCGSREKLYQLAQWPVLGECSPNEYYPIRDVVRLIHAAEYMAGDIDLALQTIKFTKPVHYGLCGLLALTSTTVLNLLRMQLQHRKLIACFGHSSTYYKNGCFIYEWSPITETYQNCHYLQRVTFLVWVSILRQLSDDKFSMIKIEFCFPKPKELAEYIRVFGENISFSHATTKMFIDPSMLNLPLNQGNAELHAMLKTLAAPILKNLSHQDTCESKVRMALASLLPKGEGNLTSVAQYIGFSKRTLQRQLKTEQTSFGFVLEEYRKEKVEYYLVETEQSILEIALFLGYSDSNSLNVAFRNWFDTCPSVYRKKFQQHKTIIH
ncbi:AraC family transcriptional regulator [Thalassotalea sp. G2M2-11]|uniref:AraC family transcriptional regulator n=1 Tax=Thalassotalea sp. G2M2-11 TaxID=2787627 RepID=UPI0019D05CAC|nr:AraC family transcriptional regulator [Thalassotalea sp. G2M2-11]